MSAPKTFQADLAQNDRGEDNTVKLFRVMAVHPGMDQEALGDSLLLKRPPVRRKPVMAKQYVNGGERYCAPVLVTPKAKPHQEHAARLLTYQLKGVEVMSKTPAGLPDQLKSGVESLSGVSLDDVRVHYNSAKPAQLNTSASAQGADAHTPPSQQEHVPHEAWHVVTTRSQDKA